MLEEALRAMGDSDLILFLSPVTDSLSEYERFLELKESKKIPHIVVLTKVDFVSNEELLKKLNEFQKYQDRFKAIIPFSVKKGVGKDALLDEVVKYLPESPPLFDTEIMTTENIRDIYKELIREAIFESFSDEIPYESDVTIEKIYESDRIDKIYATIILEKPSQKGIVIGKRGEGIKRIGKVAREKLELFARKQIYLDLHVSVKKGWSKSKKGLEEQGYIF